MLSPDLRFVWMQGFIVPPHSTIILFPNKKTNTIF